MKLPDPEPDHGRPSQETRDLRPDDALLRAHGWSVYARPKNGPALWRHRTGPILEHEYALLLTRLAQEPGGEEKARRALRKAAGRG